LLSINALTPPLTTMKKILITFLLFWAHWGSRAQVVPANMNLINYDYSYFEAGLDTAFDINCWKYPTNEGSFYSFPFPYVYFDTTLLKFIRVDSVGWAIQIGSWFSLNVSQSTHKVINKINSHERRDYGQNKLIAPLIAGQQYHFSVTIPVFRFSSKGWSYHGSFWLFENKIRNFGVYFSDTSVYDYTTRERLKVTPQLNFRGYDTDIMDTTVFVKLKGTYTAVGGERYITVGNFDSTEDFYVVNNIYKSGSDTIDVTTIEQYIMDLSLVADTSLPMIQLTKFTLGNDTVMACSGDTMQLGGAAHYLSYLWNTGDTSRFITVTTPGKYWCTVELGCSSYSDTLLISPPPFSFSLGADRTIDCTKDTILLTAPVDGTYTWSTGATSRSIEVTTPGTYWCKIENACSSFTDTIVFDPLPFSFSLGTDRAIDCTKDTILLTASVDGTYTWNTGATSRSIEVTTPGTYWCKIENECSSFTDTIVFDPLPFSFSLGADRTIDCTKDTILLTAPVDGTYTWSTGATSRSIEVTTPGTYWCKIENACSSFTDTIVFNPLPFSFSLGADRVICTGDTFRLIIDTGFISYTWSTGSSERSILVTTPGTYWCRVTANCGVYTDTIRVLPTQLPDTFDIQDDWQCPWAYPVVVSATKPYAQYLWSNGSTTSMAHFDAPGTYWLTVYNECGDKSYTDTFRLGYLSEAIPKIDLGEDRSLCVQSYYLDTVLLQAPEGYEYLWSTSSIRKEIAVHTPGTYWVRVSNSCYTESDTVIFEGCAPVPIPEIFIPNAFSPNGDAVNDDFYIPSIPAQVVSYNMLIFNRYGTHIATISESNPRWNGGDYQLGVYYYIFRYKDVTGKEYQQKGDIILLR
jgi:gliding motility-associated-like protein